MYIRKVSFFKKEVYNKYIYTYICIFIIILFYAIRRENFGLYLLHRIEE